METNGPQVGVGILVLKEGNILFGIRWGSHGEGEWSVPGGKMELGESWEETAIRELKEETGIEIDSISFLCVANTTRYMEEDPKKHYIHIGLVAHWKAGDAIIREPDRCKGWKWFSPDDLPEPMFAMTKFMIMSYVFGIVEDDRDETEKITREYDAPRTQEKIKAYFKNLFLEQSKKRYTSDD